MSTSKDAKVSMFQLDETNWTDWFTRMRGYLMMKCLWQYIDMLTYKLSPQMKFNIATALAVTDVDPPETTITPVDINTQESWDEDDQQELGIILVWMQQKLHSDICR
ncbi:uncharacterized protein LAESUDRAFT_716589 [Laetiporus sulphureus 93-53]|uniref:Uncharacterized protein n=1 Tax=Laetiporus sulphureus 93-53 TaxID=1314785 RepID=A0A165CH75_9APHY|nr:uncharacterized protein LAESUDRAFT_716589 [Laetiporus sulphureus 93-53]KZT02805.1 hypothetical protein LAESUDRAFT_716589 [Laetiporus sulphureus 93-53]